MSRPRFLEFEMKGGGRCWFRPEKVSQVLSLDTPGNCHVSFDTDSGVRLAHPPAKVVAAIESHLTGETGGKSEAKAAPEPTPAANPIDLMVAGRATRYMLSGRGVPDSNFPSILYVRLKGVTSLNNTLFIGRAFWGQNHTAAKYAILAGAMYESKLTAAKSIHRILAALGYESTSPD